MTTRWPAGPATTSEHGGLRHDRDGQGADAALEDRCVDTIRFLAVDAVQKANSGHPGTPMALAPAAHVLFTRHLRYDPTDPAWPDRDRFVLSAGHASMLLYSMLHLTGYDLSLDDLKAFRQWGSRTPGHPEHGVVPGVETTTGPLGQGLANAVGMAIAEAHLAAEFNDAEHQVVDHRTYVIAGDGDLMEGVASEAASLAGHLALGKLIVLYDDNHISIDGSTDLAFTEDRVKRFEAYGWHVQRVADGNDREAIDAALTAAEAETAQAVLHRPAHAHRLRLAEQAGHGGRARRAARRRRGEADEGEPRLAARAGLPRAGRGGTRTTAGRRRARRRRTRSGAAARRPGGPPIPAAPSAGTTPGRAPCRRAGTRACRCIRPTPKASRRASRRARRSPRSCRRCRR